MSKELEEAKTRLYEFIHNINLADKTIDNIKQDVYTVLNYIDNSISKEKVKKVFETKIHNKNYLAKTDWTDYQREVDLRVANLLEIIMQELLEGK